MHDGNPWQCNWNLCGPFLRAGLPTKVEAGARGMEVHGRHENIQLLYAYGIENEELKLI